MKQYIKPFSVIYTLATEPMMQATSLTIDDEQVPGSAALSKRRRHQDDWDADMELEEEDLWEE